MEVSVTVSQKDKITTSITHTHTHSPLLDIRHKDSMSWDWSCSSANRVPSMHKTLGLISSTTYTRRLPVILHSVGGGGRARSSIILGYMAKFKARLSCVSHSFINRLSYPTIEMLAHPCLLVLFLQQQRNGISLSVPRFFCIAGSWTKGFSILSNLSRSIVLAVAWISSNRWMDNENVLYIHCGILFSYKQKRKQEICRKMGSPGNITLKEVTQSQILLFSLI